MCFYEYGWVAVKPCTVIVMKELTNVLPTASKNPLTPHSNNESIYILKVLRSGKHTFLGYFCTGHHTNYNCIPWWKVHSKGGPWIANVKVMTDNITTDERRFQSCQDEWSRPLCCSSFLKMPPVGYKPMTSSPQMSISYQLRYRDPWITLFSEMSDDCSRSRSTLYYCQEMYVAHLQLWVVKANIKKSNNLAPIPS